ncbi:MAG: N-acetyltransferase family protein [Phormidesmis sp.]
MKTAHSIRPLTPEDEPILWEMLMYAAHESSLETVKANPELARYVEGFGRNGDVGVVVENTQQPLGAAWVRLWSGEEKGYGYVSDEIPELAIAVHPNYRTQGIGTQLLNSLLNHAKSHFPAISLSIRADNPALRLYERTGFIPISGSEIMNREGGQSFNMIARFT